MSCQKRRSARMGDEASWYPVLPWWQRSGFIANRRRMKGISLPVAGQSSVGFGTAMRTEYDIRKAILYFRRSEASGGDEVWIASYYPRRVAPERQSVSGKTERRKDAIPLNKLLESGLS